MTNQFPILFNPLDWYWLASDGRIYSSKRNILVYTYDSPYLSFLAINGGTTPWPTDGSGKQTTAAMQAVMTPYGIVLPFN